MQRRLVVCLISVVLVACSATRPQVAERSSVDAGNGNGRLSAAVDGRSSNAEICAAFRAEWVANFFRSVYQAQRGNPDLAVSEPLGGTRDEALWALVAARGLGPGVCQVPSCYTTPHSGWYQPHCGYRVPNADGGKSLYSWVSWRNGPPPATELATARQRELESNQRVRTCGDQRGSLC